VNRNHLFHRYLRSRNLKDTAERSAILDCIASLEKRHFTADDLVAAFRGRGATVSRATVYRTLDHLVCCGLVRRLILGRGHSVFENSLGRQHHEHMACLDCGRVLEFSSRRVRSILERECRENKFVSLGYDLQILGSCEDCASGPNPSRREGG
jgi:Fur family ferric uptake transcriptional regulator